MLIVFPAELPDAFFEELDCVESDMQFAGFYYDPAFRRVLLHWGFCVRLCQNPWVLEVLFAYPEVATWCQRNKIVVLTGAQWLIYDYVNRRSYIADPETARRCLEEQFLVCEVETRPLKSPPEEPRKNAPRRLLDTKATKKANAACHLRVVSHVLGQSSSD
jgi:hypothetical protein